MAKPYYNMKLSLNVLEHLGINLYSNVPSVLSEVVANSWDADASRVDITTDRASNRIEIKDDGIGMTGQEVNERFLLVGYRRRDEQGELTEKGRAPMGRKGIGKLSLFSIADIIEVYTVKNGDKNAFRMKLEDIREKIKSGSGTYEPNPIDTKSIKVKQGTHIILKKLRRRQTLGTSMALRRRLARRFSIIGPTNDFRVYINKDEITPSDRDYYKKIQYIWTYGDQKEIIKNCINHEEKEDRSTFVKNRKPAISGWLATVKESRNLRDEEGDNLNRIAIYVRGKMAQEDILADYTERGVYASYLIGEIKVDELDLDGEEDAATSSRQRIVEDDPRYVQLKKIIGDELKHIQNKWSEWRTEAGARKALEIPAVNNWIKGLPKAIRPRAKKWLGKINRLKTDEIDEQKQLIKHSVLAFEFYRCNENLERLEEIDDENLPAAMEIFKELDGLEANLYGQIVQQRIAVIRALHEKVDKKSLEKVIQEYIFDHLWLIDPHWERVDAPPVMEQRVSKLFKSVGAKLTAKEKSARIDIKYRKTAGEHVIIELKRPGRKVDLYELAKQINKYRAGMLKILQKMQKDNEPVEFICLLSEYPKEWHGPGGKKQVKDTLNPLNARIVLYDSLIEDAYAAYNDYLVKRKTVDRLSDIINAIEDYAPPGTEAN